MFNVTWPTNNYESEGVYGLHKLPFVIGSYCASYNVGNNILTGFERGNFWHGGVSHVALYNYALSAAQISNHYSAGTNASLAGHVLLDTISSTPTIIGAAFTPGSLEAPGPQFQMWLNGVSNQNYTLQMSTDLISGNWTTLSTTNSTGSDPLMLVDPDATNQQRFYRVLIGP
jgi:hypothetical protein